jgi:cytochrome c556
MTTALLRWQRWVAMPALALAVISCDHHNQPAPPSPAATSPQKHWVQSERLAKVMEQLSGLRGAFPRGLPDDPESPAGREARRSLAEAAAVADALAETAKRIPAAVEGKPMSPADRRGFISEATRLHDQSIALRDAARANHVEPLQELLDNVNSTCISCHSRFRDLTGELNTHKAAAPGSSPQTAAGGALARAHDERAD